MGFRLLFQLSIQECWILVWPESGQLWDWHGSAMDRQGKLCTAGDLAERKIYDCYKIFIIGLMLILYKLGGFICENTAIIANRRYP